MSDRTRNYLILIANPAIFGLGFNIMSPVTILPVFVSLLTDSNMVIGAITPLVRMAWAIPLIYGARYFEGRAYKARRLFVISSLGRIVFIAYGGFVIATGGEAATLSLVLFFVALFAMWGSDGFTSPAWAEMFSKIVDARARGRLMGMAQTFGGIMAGVGVFFAARFLSDNPVPSGFAVLFVVAALILKVSHGVLVFLKEPPSPPVRADPNPIWRAGNRIPRLLRDDPLFRSLILARLLIGFGMISFGFFAVFATRGFDVGIEQIGLFTTILLVTQTGANLASGLLNDRIGPVRLASAGGLIVVIAAVLAATTQSDLAFFPIFVCVGLSQAAFAIADFTLIFEAAPPEKMTTYLATYHGTTAPLLVFVALAAGLLADIAVYRVMFVVSSLFAVAGVALMIHLSRRRGMAGAPIPVHQP